GAVVELLERQVVRPRGDQLGGVRGPAAGQPDHHVEHLDREYETEHEDHLDDRPDDRERDPDQALPRSGAVDPGGLHQLWRDVLERAVQQHGEERHADPDVGDQYGQVGPARIDLEPDWLMHEMEIKQDLVDRAGLKLEQELEDDPGHQQRQQPRDEDERPRQGPQRKPQAEQQRESEPDEELEQQR